MHTLWPSCISMVPDQSGVCQAWYILEIHHSGREPSISTHTLKKKPETAWDLLVCLVYLPDCVIIPFINLCYFLVYQLYFVILLFIHQTVSFSSLSTKLCHFIIYQQNCAFFVFYANQLICSISVITCLAFTSEQRRIHQNMKQTVTASWLVWVQPTGRFRERSTTSAHPAIKALSLTVSIMSEVKSSTTTVHFRLQNFFRSFCLHCCLACLIF